MTDRVISYLVRYSSRLLACFTYNAWARPSGVSAGSRMPWARASSSIVAGRRQPSRWTCSSAFGQRRNASFVRRGGPWRALTPTREKAPPPPTRSPAATRPPAPAGPQGPPRPPGAAAPPPGRPPAGAHHDAENGASLAYRIARVHRPADAVGHVGHAAPHEVGELAVEQLDGVAHAGPRRHTHRALVHEDADQRLPPSR